jgi:1-phosphofructokinase
VIVTLTPNPSLDRTYEVSGLDRGAVLRASGVRVDPGGKGINVARALAANDVATRAVVPAGGHEGEHLLDTLAALAIPVIAVPTAGVVRTNISLVEPDGCVTKINAPGQPLSDAETSALVGAVVDAVADAAWVAGCGSLPPGTDPAFYADLVRRGHDAGARVAIDASGAAFTAALAAGPDLLKPNTDELAEAVDRPLRTVGDVLDAARELQDRGARTVVVSLGADGALLVEGDEAWQATTQPITPRSAVGAGDSLVAGLLAASSGSGTPLSTDGLGPEALRHGVAYGTAAALLPGTQVPRPHDLDLAGVDVRPADVARPLTEPGARR